VVSFYRVLCAQFGDERWNAEGRKHVFSKKRVGHKILILGNPHAKNVGISARLSVVDLLKKGFKRLSTRTKSALCVGRSPQGSNRLRVGDNEMTPGMTRTNSAVTAFRLATC